MEFVYVNKNKLIPSIKKYSSLEKGLEKIFRKTFEKQNVYCNNIYLIEFYNLNQVKIYFSNRNKIYKYDNDEIIKIEHDFIKNSFDTIYNKICSFSNSDFNIKTNSKLNKIIKDTKEKEEKNINDEEKIKKKKELRQMCDEVIETYNKEKENHKKIMLNIKKLEKEENLLIKKIRSNKIDNLSVLFYDLNTYNKINNKILKDDEPIKENDERIPLLFMKKYKYLKPFCEKYVDLCNLLLKIDINKLINSDIDYKIPDIPEEKIEEIFIISKIYNDASKNLNVEFSHSWEELDHDIEGNRLAP